MSIKLPPWVHSFTVTETQLYNRKFTIYRINVVIFPSNQPAALSCFTTWKRYSDVKELQQRLAKRVKRERLAIKLPSLSKFKNRSGFFDRFHNDVIEGRRQLILELLEFIGTEPSLYSCDLFTKFLQSGYTPHMSSRDTVDDANGGTEFLSPESSFSTSHLLCALDQSDRRTSESEDHSSSSLAESEQVNTAASSQTPGGEATLPRYFSSDYIVEASERFTEGVLREVNDRYSEALAIYKEGIEILLTNVRTETDPSRLRVAKEKAAKYITRSENLYEHFLKPSTSGADPLSRTVTPRTKMASRELPIHQLAKYKVLRVLDDNVMSVQEVTTRRYFIIKSIDRTEEWIEGAQCGEAELEAELAYMVPLVAYFVTEFVIFLLLQPASGGKLLDHIEAYCDEGPTTATAALANKEMEGSLEEAEEVTAPAFDTMTMDLDIDELLVSSQLLLNSVQRTLDEDTGPFEIVPELDLKTDSTAVEMVENVTESVQPQRRLPEACVRQWAKELIVAVNALHGKNIVLGHLGTENLLLGKNGQLLLTHYHHRDFSKAIAKHSYSKDSYHAPDRPAGQESDWYNVGVILYELLTGQKFGRYHPGGVWWYFDLQCPSEYVQLSPAAASLIRGLLGEDSKYRFGFADICAHPFFYKAVA